MEALKAKCHNLRISKDMDTYFDAYALLGQGSFGKVYAAKTLPLARTKFDASLPRHVAIKKIKMKTYEDAHNVAQEIAIMRKLNLRYGMKYYGCYVSKTIVHCNGVL